jgi:RNA polymerase sigma-70 factor (ECF subfamily)
MINTLINEYKKEKNHHANLQYVEEYYDTDKHSDMNDAMKKIDAEQIYKFIAALPAASQQVFNLYYIDGFKHKEIAEMLGISEGTSKWHLNAARERLKELLKKNELLEKEIQHG